MAARVLRVLREGVEEERPRRRDRRKGRAGSRPKGVGREGHRAAQESGRNHRGEVQGVEGKEVIRTEGYLKSFHNQSVMDYVASLAYQSEPSFQRFIEWRADQLREKGATINIME